MEKYVYKITNLINGKSYIGQTINIERRFKEHCIKHCNYVSLINNAIKKYGSSNFKIEQLYYGEDYNEKEKQYIREYNTIAPNGYNLVEGGEDPPHLRGEEVGTSKISNDVAKTIQYDLINGMPLKDVQKKYDQITSGQINRINNGEAWYNPIYTYPLSENFVNKVGPTKTSQAIFLIENTNLTLKEIGEKLGLSKSTVVNINQGKTKASKELRKNFPLRKDAIDDTHLSNEEIVQIIDELINTKNTMDEIGERYGVSQTVIAGINKGFTKKYRITGYNYPIRNNKL